MDLSFVSWYFQLFPFTASYINGNIYSTEMCITGKQHTYVPKSNIGSCAIYVKSELPAASEISFPLSHLSEKISALILST